MTEERIICKEMLLKNYYKSYSTFYNIAILGLTFIYSLF